MRKLQAGYCGGGDKDRKQLKNNPIGEKYSTGIKRDQQSSAASVRQEEPERLVFLYNKLKSGTMNIFDIQVGVF